MKRLALVAAGGILGSLCRYLISELTPRLALSVLIANILGVAIAGIVGYRIVTSDESRAFWIPGVAGGMTTFSSVALIHAQSNSILAIGYFYGTVLVSLLVLHLCRPKVNS